jgi:hypothetical protein
MRSGPPAILRPPGKSSYENISPFRESLRGQFAVRIHWNHPATPPAQLSTAALLTKRPRAQEETGIIFRRRKIRISPMCRTARRPIAAWLELSDPLRMSAPTCVKLSPEEKLEILRRLDEFHFWHSLDDRRMCRECGHSITGWEIQVIEGKHPRDRMRLQCPTEGCVSSPSQWVYADPVLAARLRSDIPSFDLQSTTQIEDLSVIYRGRIQTVRRASHRYNEKAAVAGPFGAMHPGQRSFSFRAAVARLPLLRSVATGLHAFHPIA